MTAAREQEILATFERWLAGMQGDAWAAQLVAIKTRELLARKEVRT